MTRLPILSFAWLAGCISGQWTKFENLNCWSGYGGKPKDPQDNPLKLPLSGCKLACMADAACVAITVGDTSGCWLRTAVNTKYCQQTTDFSTYTNGRDPFQWIADIERSGGASHLKPGTYLIDRQYTLPTNAQIWGAGEGKTIIQAVRWTHAQGTALCDKNHVNRIGIIVGDNTQVGQFTFTGADFTRPGDNGWLCGGGAIEFPGCATPYCTSPLNTGNGDGNGASNVLIENIEITKDTVQNMVFMPQTAQGKRVSSDVTIRGVHTTGTWADGLNVHGAHKNVLVEGCSASNTGDDCFAAWDSSVENEFLTNITFKDNYASNPHFNNNRDCFSQFGGRTVNYIGNTCESPTSAMIHFWIQFCGHGQGGSPGKSVCYPADSVSHVMGNINKSPRPLILQDARPVLPKIINGFSASPSDAFVELV